jgi:hypothetical protein
MKSRWTSIKLSFVPSATGPEPRSRVDGPTGHINIRSFPRRGCSPIFGTLDQIGGGDISVGLHWTDVWEQRAPKRNQCSISRFPIIPLARPWHDLGTKPWSELALTIGLRRQIELVWQTQRSIKMSALQIE